MDSPNILITNFCNQNCRFCFASKEMMGDLNKERLLTYEEFKKIAKKVAKKYSFIRLLGGEPLIHPHVKEILTYSSVHFSHVQIFTNGLFNEKLIKLFSSPSNFQLIVNCSTPAYKINVDSKLKIIENMYRSKGAARSASITLEKNDNGRKIAHDLLSDMSFLDDIRLGIANPIVGARNNDPFPVMINFGVEIVNFVREIKKMKPTIRVVFNCGFVRCMFTDKDYDFLKKNTSHLGWGCFGKQASFDFATDKKAFFCFPFSGNKITTKNKPITNVASTLLLHHYKRWKNSGYDKCKSCKYHGFEVDKCPGPCLGLRGNTM